MSALVNQKVRIGDKVTFDNDKIELFKAETNRDDQEIQEYSKSVLVAIDQVGVVKELGFAVATVSYPNDLELSIPTKYLVMLPENE